MTGRKDTHGHLGETEHPVHHGRRHRLVQRQRLQPRRHGLPHAEHRPDRPGGRAVHRLLRAAELHGRPRRIHHRAGAHPHRPHEGGHAGRHAGAERRGPLGRPVPEGLRLCHRPVRQEPPGRPQRAPADRARLRRVLRQPLSPERRGRAGVRELSQGPGVPQEVRSARRAEVQGHRQGRPDRRRAVRQGRQADDREHRTAHAQAHGDGGRGVHRRGASTSWSARRRKAGPGSATSIRPACTSSRT